MLAGFSEAQPGWPGAGGCIQRLQARVWTCELGASMGVRGSACEGGMMPLRSSSFQPWVMGPPSPRLTYDLTLLSELR